MVVGVISTGASFLGGLSSYWSVLYRRFTVATFTVLSMVLLCLTEKLLAEIIIEVL